MPQIEIFISCEGGLVQAVYADAETAKNVRIVVVNENRPNFENEDELDIVVVNEDRPDFENEDELDMSPEDIEDMDNYQRLVRELADREKTGTLVAIQGSIWNRRSA